MEETKNTYKEYTLTNGEKVNLTLTFSRLNLLKKIDRDLYDHFNDINFGKSEDMLDIVTMIYVAYWCANFKVGKKIYNEEEFIELVEFDLTEIKRVQTALLNPKKK